MRSLQGITGLMFILYIGFLFLNSFELFNKLDILFNQNKYGLNYYPVLNSIHNGMDLVAAVCMVILLFLLNHLLYKQYLVKRVHWSLIILSIVPVVHFFVYFPILRKMNSTLFLKRNLSAKTSDILIFSTWIILLSSFGLALFIGVMIYLGYKNGAIQNPKLIYSSFSEISQIVLKLLVSITMGLYFWHLLRCLKSKDETQDFQRNDALLD